MKQPHTELGKEIDEWYKQEDGEGLPLSALYERIKQHSKNWVHVDDLRRLREKAEDEGFEISECNTIFSDSVRELIEEKKHVLCIYCKKKIHINQFAGIQKKGLFCNRTMCIIAFVKDVEDKE